MLRRITAVLAATALAVTALGGTANANSGWVANSPSSIVSSSTVRLVGGNTSVENQDLDVPVQAGDVISFRYQLLGGAQCVGGAPRVFVEVAGVFTNSWDQNQPGGTQCGTNGTVTFTVPANGRVGQAGVVYDNGGPGAVLVSGLTIDGRAVHFSRPRPDVRVTPTAPTATQPACDARRGVLTIPSVRGVTYTVNNRVWRAGPHDVSPGVYRVTASVRDGYQVPRGTVLRWRLVVNRPSACPTPKPTPTPTPTVTPTIPQTPVPAQPVTPEAPVVQQPTCATEGVARITIPEVEGVVYGPETSGTYVVKPGKATVTAEAADGYTLTDGAETEWAFTVDDPPPSCPGPAGEDGADGKDGKVVTVNGVPVPSRIDTGLGGTA